MDILNEAARKTGNHHWTKCFALLLMEMIFYKFGSTSSCGEALPVVASCFCRAGTQIWRLMTILSVSTRNNSH